MSKLILCFLFEAIILTVKAQDAEQDIDKILRSVAYLYEDIAGTRHSGTGFVVLYDKQSFLVTAKHVATIFNDNMHVVVKGDDGKPLNFLFSDLIGHTPHTWVFSDSSDIAVHLIFGNRLYSDSANQLLLTPSSINSKLSSVARDFEITIAGFPLQLGIGKYFSPISRVTRVASDLIETSDSTDPVFLLTDPSVQGYSGGPVFKTSKVEYLKEGISVHKSIQLIGLVSATALDDTGGKMGVVVPSYFILETLKKARRFNCIQIIKYPNSNLWTRVEYRNGLIWNVLENLKPNGTPQNKGTLKDGNGSIFLYDEYGKLMIVETYKDGLLVDSVKQ